MATSPAHLDNTELNNRVLWFDGDSTVPEDQLINIITKRGSADGLFVDHITDTLRQYNRLVADTEQQIRIKEDVRPMSLSWNLPAEYADINVTEYVEDCMVAELERLGWYTGNIPKTGTERILRTSHELKLYESLGLTNVIRTLIYVINTLQARNVVWGVGRGSSVASYVLYLIGVHDVDSIEYELDITEFLRPE